MGTNVTSRPSPSGADSGLHPGSTVDAGNDRDRTGILIAWVALIGIGGVAGLGYLQHRSRPQLTETATAHATALLDPLIERARIARNNLDIAGLTEVTPAIANIAEHAPLRVIADRARLELLDIYGTLGLEAAIRAAFPGQCTLRR